MWVLSQGKIVSWTDPGSPSRFTGTHTDITKQKEAEEKLKKSERIYRNIFLNAQIGLFRIQLDTLRLIECNDAIANMLGYNSRKECLENFSAPQSFASQSDLRRFLKTMRKHGHVRNDVSQFLRKDGSRVWLRTTARVIAKENYLEGVVEDITDYRKAETEKNILKEKLERSKKMEALGLLAGSVAHDLNNILAGIINYPELMLLQLESDSNFIRPLQAIQDSGRRAATVVDDLLTIARGAASIKEVQCLHSIIEDYSSSPEFLQHRAAHPGITIVFQLEAHKSTILCSPVHITKSLMNVVNNSIEAMESSGTLTISTTNRVDESDDVIALKIHDTGSGVTPEDLKHIFEPFYTKKIMGKSGTGLGLTVVWNTMEDHGGEVLAESSSEGTTFTLVFPLSRLSVKSSPQSFDIQKLMGNGQKILIVDDELHLRDIAQKLLESLNYSCVAVGSGEEAITYLKDDHVDLVLLDMLMEPGINGRQTYEEIIRSHPGQKAVLASGYSNSREVERAIELGIGAFVKKPYSLQQLGRVIQEQLKKDVHHS